MAIETEFLLDYTNKRVYHDNGTTVYTVNALYTMIMNTLDELAQMDDTVPMSAQTPNAYTMINGWFLDIGEGSYAHKYLKEGSIATDDYTGAIRLLKLESGSWHAMVPGDIGKIVAYHGGVPADSGTCIGYDNTRHYIWVRTTDTFADAATLITVDGSDSDDLIAAGGSLSGEDLYANIYTLGTISSDPYGQIYVFQSGTAISEWSTLTNFDRGQIDVLVQVMEADVEIALGVITVFDRQEGDSYDNFEIDLTAGGRNAVPLGTATDLNNLTGSYYLLYDGQSTAFVVGETINDQTTGAEAEVVSDDDRGAYGILKLRAVNGIFGDNNNIRSGATVRAVVNGTLGDTLAEFDAQSANFTTIGQILTGSVSGAKRLLRGQYDGGAAGILVMQVDDTVWGITREKYYLDFENNDVVTGASDGSCTLSADSVTLVSGFTDIQITFVNGSATHSGTTGTFEENEKITFIGGSGIVLEDTGTTLVLGNMTITAINGLTATGAHSGATCDFSQDLQSLHTMLKAYDLGTPYPYDVIIECASRVVEDVYEYVKFVTRQNSVYQMYTVVAGVITPLDGEEYIQAYTGYSPVKSSPFGTFAGGAYYGARGVWLEHMDDLDNQSYSLIDSNGDTRNPPNKQTIAVSGLTIDDRVTVFRTTVGTTIDRAIQSVTSGAEFGSVIVLDAGLDNDTPAVGVVRIVDVSLDVEYRIRYDSWLVDEITLRTKVTGTADAGGSETLLVDAAGAFNTKDLLYGDIVVNETTGGYAYVLSIDATEVTTTTLSTGVWGVGDTYSFHVLPVLLDGADTIYIPYIDVVADDTTESVIVEFVSTRNILTRVRKKGIIPFEIAGQFIATGATISAIRNTDSIVA
jgi:hypothetical protein